MFRVVFLSMTFLVTSLVGHAELLFQIGIYRWFFWFGVQSRRFISASGGVVVSFWLSKSLIISQYWRSEPPFIRDLWHSESSEPPSFLSFDVRSRHRVFSSTFRVTFLVLAFRAIIVTFLGFGVQSHHRIFVRCSELSSSHSQFRRAEPPSLPSLTFRVAFLVSVFRAIIASSFGVQSHHSSVSVFKAILVVFSVSAFRAIITPQLTFKVVFSFDVQSHYIIHSDVRSHVLLRLAFRALVHFDSDFKAIAYHSFQHPEPCFALFGF